MLTEHNSANERNRKERKKEKTSSEARKPIINLNCTKSLMGKYSDGKKGVRDCTHDFITFNKGLFH